jgi:Tetratricopeptide repeat/Bacterial SH3 domain
MSRWILAILAVLLLAVTAAGAQEINAAFDAANRLYEQGKYPEAAAAYEKLVHAGKVSAAVFYNMGNAWFKARQIGRAILAYRRAEALAPRDPDVRANLQFARNQVQGPAWTPTRMDSALRRLTLNEWTLLTAVPAWLLLLAIAAGQFRPGLKPLLRSLGSVLGVLTVAFLTLAILDWHVTKQSAAAVVIAPEAVVRRGPFEESPAAFTVHDGAELQISDRKDDWLEVTAGPRRAGWVRRQAVLPSPS